MHKIRDALIHAECNEMKTIILSNLDWKNILNASLCFDIEDVICLVRVSKTDGSNGSLENHSSS